MPLEKTREEQAAEAQEKEHWHRVASTLKDLTVSEGWDCYKNLAEGIERQIIEELVSATREEHDYLKGYVMGLRKALHLPREIVLRVKA